MLNSLILHMNNAIVSIAADGGQSLHGWGKFKSNMVNFFQKGLGGDGATGIGTAILVTGIVLAIVSFVWHHMNPQSRFPGAGKFLVAAILGSLLVMGIQTPMNIIGDIRDWLISLVAG